MTTAPPSSLPGEPEARTLDFPALSRLLRQALDCARTRRLSRSESEIRSLIRILEAKIPPCPPAPQEPQLPAAPETPAEPKRPEFEYSPSRAFRDAESQFQKKIDKSQDDLRNPQHAHIAHYIRKTLSQLREQRDQTLHEIMLKEVDASTAEKLRAWREPWKKWQRQVEHIKSNHNQLLERKFLAPYRDVRAQWEIARGEWERETEIPRNIVKRLGAAFEELFLNPTAISLDKLPWRFLPPGEVGEKQMLRAVLEFRERNPGVVIDEGRLRHAYGLKPQHVYVGEEDFDGYFAFVFGETALVLLENPIEGNAAYIFKQEWRSLSRLTKGELLANHPHQIARVFHKGAWKARLNRLLLVPPPCREDTSL